MRTIFPLIIVVVFWGKFLLGMFNPKIGDAIISFTFIGLVISLLIFVKRALRTFIANFESK